MKQKVVIKVDMNGHKSRTKAFKIAVGIPGVEAASIGGQEKNQIEVTGEGVDAIELTTLLRSKVGHAELLSVSAVGEKKEQDKKDETGQVLLQSQQQMPYVYYGLPPHYIHQVRDTNPYDDSCSIM